LELREVRLGVRTISDGSAQTPAPFGAYRLPRPRRYAITPCEYGLENPMVVFTGAHRSYLLSSAHAHTYFLPQAADDVRQAIVLDNYAEGYQYEPNPTTRSPIAMTARYWTRDLGGGNVLCGPRLAVARDRSVEQSDFIVDSQERLEVQTLEN